MDIEGVFIDDTFAEGFTSNYSRFLITAKNRKWAEIAAKEATGYGTSMIGCSAEGGIEGYLDDSKTPDGRVGVVVQIWGSKKRMLHELLGRIGQGVLTSPTASVFNWCDDCEKIDVGRKMRYFGDGFASKKKINDRRMYALPIMMGEFLIERYLGVGKGVAGGNFLIMSEGQDPALEAAEAAQRAVEGIEGAVTCFPGGICASGSKVGSNKYDFMKATTNEFYCPSLRSQVQGSLVPEGVASIAEIVINGLSVETVKKAMKSGIEAAVKIKGIKQISAANYGGKLGDVPIKLHDLWR